MKTSGRAGHVVAQGMGPDTKGGSQSTTVTFTLH